MKRFLIFLAFGSFLMAASLDEIDKKLDYLIKKVDLIEKKLDKKNKEVEAIKKDLKKEKKEIKKTLAVKDCKKIKVVSFSDTYEGGVIPSYELNYKLKNKYPKTVTFISGNLYVRDKDGVTLLKDYFERKVNLKPNEVLNVKKGHIINSELEMDLKDENVKDLNFEFKLNEVKFSDFTSLECN
ncbi:MAG: hypothetical protein ABGX26_05030 [Nautiliaceae bacterium]